MKADAQVTLDGARINSLPELLACAVALGAQTVPELSHAEPEVLAGLDHPRRAVVKRLRRLIRAGTDPLGYLFTRIKTPEERRPLGATYTPDPIVRAMVDWAASAGPAARVVDGGVGSGRFLTRAGEAFPDAELIGVEIDPVAALIARANLAAAGLARRSRIIVGDYRDVKLRAVDGPTVFLGNPPYVRHHLIPNRWKDWFAAQAQVFGLRASRLAGLHVHFLLATCALARDGDFGCFITAAEWLDVNYGSLVRQLFLGRLGGKAFLVIEPTARPFPDAASTAVIVTFRIGERPSSIRLRRVKKLGSIAPIGGGVPLRRERLSAEQRWGHLLHATGSLPDGFVELGELCRVHRGQVTGANRVWIAGPHSRELPEDVLYPAVTRARDLFEAGDVLDDAGVLRQVIDLPIDLDTLPVEVLPAVTRFLEWARSQGADTAYVARHRRAWWSVGLREPPPILATYMARRPPAFVHNKAGARYINVAHGIYPREPLSERLLETLVHYLTRVGKSARGRTYAGGLMKFEPREMERTPVPGPDLLEAQAPR